MPISADHRRVVIADAGPLIALGRLDRLDLLPRLFTEVQVTATVVMECLARPGLPDAVRIAAALDAGHLCKCPDPDLDAEVRLDPGESSAIARALEIGAGLVMDDRAGVAHARAQGLRVIGTLGILVLAKQKSLIPQVRPLLERLRDDGHYLGDAAILTALALAGEE